MIKLNHPSSHKLANFLLSQPDLPVCLTKELHTLSVVREDTILMDAEDEDQTPRDVIVLLSDNDYVTEES